MSRLRGATTFACLLILIGLARASPTLAEKRAALVIGNSAYTHIQRLPNPANDA